MPDSGELHLNGREITQTPASKRDIALVFQNFSLYPDRSVRQNLEFPLLLPGRDLPPHEIQEWIGRAIVRRPGLSLLEEPFSNLDAKLRESLRVKWLLLQKTLGAPMIL